MEDSSSRVAIKLIYRETIEHLQTVMNNGVHIFHVIYVVGIARTSVNLFELIIPNYSIFFYTYIY